MTFEKTLDPRYRVNIEIGMRVMIEEEDKNSELTPCYVKEIITQDVMNESGIKVVCEDDKIGRVKHIGTETAFMTSMELITNLERKIRYLIAEELSKGDPDWWENKIHPRVQEEVNLEKQKGKIYKKVLQIPNYELIEETYFSHFPLIILSDKNWKNYFEKIFHDANALRVKLSELSPYRNLPAHSKDLTPHIEKKIQVYYDDIVHLIEFYQRK
jgi:uncharacterized repeat protein (TIGR03833 family)